MPNDHINMRIDPKLKKKVKVKCAELQIDMTTLITLMLEGWIKKEK